MPNKPDDDLATVNDAGAGDVSLADIIETRDVPVEITPEAFDMSKWAAGVRPARRAVKINSAAHLLSVMDRIADQIDEAPEGADVDSLIDEFESTRKLFLDGALWVTIEQRSVEWVLHTRKEAARRLGITLDVDGEETSDFESRVRLNVVQLSQQIVDPPMSTDDLNAIYAGNDLEFFKLVGAAAMLNESVAESADVLTRDFSSRRSG